MAKVWVTGCAGFLGSHLCDALLAAGHEVGGNDNLSGGNHINNHVHFFPLSCNARSALRQGMKGYGYLVHTAASAHEGLSVFSPHSITMDGIAASTGIFSAAIDVGIKRIIFCSSMARYGVGNPPFDEISPCNPVDPYGIGKVATEQILKNLCKTHGIEFNIAVPHNIIGPRQRYTDPFRNVASIMINLVLQGRQPIIYGDGQQKRCFSFVDDCISCLMKMILDPTIVNETINIGPDESPITVLELAKIIWRLCGNNTHCAPQFHPDRPREVKIALCSSDKARRLLGYTTKTSLIDGLQQIIDYIKATGPRPFEYHIPLEIVTEKTPRTWTERLF